MGFYVNIDSMWFELGYAFKKQKIENVGYAFGVIFFNAGNSLKIID